MKKKPVPQNPFSLLPNEIIFIILDHIPNTKPFSLISKSFHRIESLHRKKLSPFHPQHLTKLLSRYPNITHLDLSLCPRINNSTLTIIGNMCPKLEVVNLSKSRFIGQVGLGCLVGRCGNIVEIDLSNAVELTDAAAAAVAGARNLERLKMGRCKNVTDMGVGCIAVGCLKLREVSLRWCLNVGDLGVELIAVKCRGIRKLDLSYLPITKKCLTPILKLIYLEDLILEGCFGIDDDSLVDLKQECKSLQTLDLSNCPNVSHVGFSFLTSGTECLRKLSIAYGSLVTADFADSLKRFSMLQSIKLDGSQVTSSGLRAISNYCVSLSEISLSKCLDVTDDGLSPLVTKHKDLRRIDITCCQKITDVSISHIATSCISLTSLKMELCTLVREESFVLIGQKCHFLEELDLTDNEIDNEGLKSISKCSKLSSLKLGICLNINDKGLTHFGKGCSNIVELDLYRSAWITDIGILAVAQGCTGLEMLNISYCTKITDKSLLSLSKCSMLNTLESRGCPLITSVGLSAIAEGCKRLTKLDIKKCYNINDSGIIQLAQFSHNLRQINLSFSSVTAVGVLALANISCLQSLTMLHVRGLTPGGLAAALLACGGLTKVKLQASFKSLLPRLLFEHLEARGCVFIWKDKALQAELDPKLWKLQLEDVE